MKSFLLATLTLFGCGGDVMKPAEVTCYSGGQIIYRGNSSGMVRWDDGFWSFDEAGGAAVRVTGTCIVKTL